MTLQHSSKRGVSFCGGGGDGVGVSHREGVVSAWSADVTNSEERLRSDGQADARSEVSVSVVALRNPELAATVAELPRFDLADVPDPERDLEGNLDEWAGLVPRLE